MSKEDNKEAARRWHVEIFGQGQLDLVDELFAENYRQSHLYAPPGGWPAGREGARATVRFYRTAFPDARFEVHDQIADGNVVATRWTARGTHNGPLPDLPATGLPITIEGISIEYFDENGAIVRSEVNWDLLGMMQQLGAIPTA